VQPDILPPGSVRIALVRSTRNHILISAGSDGQTADTKEQVKVKVQIIPNQCEPSRGKQYGNQYQDNVLTAVEAAVNVDANSTPPVEEEISVNKLQPATVIERGDVDANTAPLARFCHSPGR